jgi:hypothetical protein
LYVSNIANDIDEIDQKLRAWELKHAQTPAQDSDDDMLDEPSPTDKIAKPKRKRSSPVASSSTLVASSPKKHKSKSRVNTSEEEEDEHGNLDTAALYKKVIAAETAKRDGEGLDDDDEEGGDGDEEEEGVGNESDHSNEMDIDQELKELGEDPVEELGGDGMDVDAE